MNPLQRLRGWFKGDGVLSDAGRALARQGLAPIRTARPRLDNPPSFAAAFAVPALAAAWRKVRANGGAPGPDRQTIEAFDQRLEQNLATLSGELLSREYRPQAALRVWMPKPSNAGGDLRRISILTVRDRLAQRAAYAALAPFYESRFLPCSYGFRENLSTDDAVDAVLRHRDAGLRVVVDGDIRKCFDTLDHRILLALLERDLNDQRYSGLIEHWLRARVVGDPAGLRASRALGSVEQPGKGASQGAVISPLLANIYLHEFDVAITRKKHALVRYADDWAILCRSEAEAGIAKADAERALEAIGLVAHPEKTLIKDFESGWQFLGASFLGDKYFWPARPNKTRTASAAKAGAGVRAAGKLKKPYHFIE